MSPFGIILIIISIAIVFGNIFSFIYKKMKHLPTGECEYCHNKKRDILKEYRSFNEKLNK